MEQKIQFKGKVKKFPGKKSGWIYIEVPRAILEGPYPRGHFGFSSIKAKVGNTEWNTALMPMGNGEKFVALKSEIRKKENIQLGDSLEITITLQG